MTDQRRQQSLNDGHLPLDEAIAAVPQTTRQRLELRLLLGVIAIVRPVYWLVRRLRKRPFDVLSGIDELADVPSPARGTRTKESHGGHHLTAAQVAEYEKRGVLGPLPLLSADEAAEMRTFLTEAHANDWYGRSSLGAEAVAALKRNNRWTINHGAIWQERNFDEMREMAQHPVLAQRVASLIGDEVVTWRTQVFVVDGHQDGTFWHSATTFTEDGDLPALSPPAGMPEPMVNVSCWIALEDTDAANASIRMIPGTHADARLDTLIQRFSRDRVGFLMSMERADRRAALIALRYSGDIFLAGRLAFDLALRLVPDLYETVEPEDYPMRAGECILFSSNNLHGSHPNTTDKTRLAMGIRYTSADVGIFENQPTVPYSTGAGNSQIDTTPFRSGVPVHTAHGPVRSTVEAGPDPDPDTH